MEVWTQPLPESLDRPYGDSQQGLRLQQLVEDEQREVDEFQQAEPQAS